MSFRNTKENEEKNPNEKMNYNEITIEALIKHIKQNPSDKAAIDSLHNQLQKVNKQTKSHTPNKSINKKPKPLSIVIGVMIAMAIILVAVIGSQNVLKTGFCNPPDLNTYVPTIIILIILLYICCKW